jgi:hypothetical protein
MRLIIPPVLLPVTISGSYPGFNRNSDDDVHSLLTGIALVGLPLDRADLRREESKKGAPILARDDSHRQREADILNEDVKQFLSGHAISMPTPRFLAAMAEIKRRREA